MKTQQSQKYDVFFNQVNRQVITIKAESEEEAREKASRKWRKDYAHSTIVAVQKSRVE